MSLRDRLRASRHEQFVGRAAELDLFRAALDAHELPFHVVHVYGPGGIGKTTLLNEYRRLCDLAEVPAGYVDARNLMEVTPQAFEQAVAEELTDTASGRRVLLVDTYELLAPLDSWFFRTFLPEMDEVQLVVLAGRNRPAAAWRSDLGWQAELRSVPLRNLTPAESEALLRGQGVDENQCRDALAATHGHPLALTLVAERCRQLDGRAFAFSDVPDVVRALLERFVAEAPSPDHRAALEAVATVRTLDEALLADLLDRDDAHDLFAWLRALTFIEEGPRGLFPHDIAREVILTDLRWRDADRYATFHKRARRHYTAWLQRGRVDADRHEVLGSYVYLYRDNPVVEPFFAQLRNAWREAGVRRADGFREDDGSALQAMVAQHEGDESAALAGYWFEQRPEATLVFRDQEDEPVGFFTTLALEALSDEEIAADPGVKGASDFLRAQARLRGDERALLFRLWMDAEAYQGVSAVQSLIFARTVRHYLGTSNLAYSFLVCADPAYWRDVFAFADLHLIPEAAFTVGEAEYSVFGHDWRTVPPTAWLDALAGRAPEAIPSATPTRRPPLVALSAPDFAEAVQEALKHVAKPHHLHETPLLYSRLVTERVGSEAEDAERIEALCALIEEAAAELEATPKEASYFRALQMTYLKPVPTQAIAAERLDMPFSTYRRHLKRGVGHVVDALWRQETAL